MFKFTNSWFDRNINISMVIAKNLFNAKRVDILEIGSHEGKSTVWMLGNLCNIEGSSFTSIDPYLTEDETTPVTSETYKLFCHNVKLCSNYDKLTQYIDKSQNILPKLVEYNKKYDIIYIDGSHLQEDVKFDLEYSDKLVTIGGIIIMDDIGYDEKGTLMTVANTFLNEHKNYQLLLKEYQWILQKMF